MNLHLIPAPKSLTRKPGVLQLPPELFILLSPVTDHFPAERFAIEAEPLTRSQFHLTAGPSIHPQSEIHTTLDPNFAQQLPKEIRTQAYHLSISKTGIQLTAHANPGLFYAFQTLLQILRESAWQQTNDASPKNRKSKIKNQKSKTPITNYQLPITLPCLSLSDHPDFPRRGIYHDTARGKVPTVATLLQLIDDLAHLKINEFQLYIENNFHFRKHPAISGDTTPFTSEELLLLDAACRARYIDFVPSLTSLGHFEKILSIPQYRSLAEAEPAQLKAIGATCWHEDAPWSLCVTDPKAQQLLTDMYAEFAPNFSSPQFNICCDEAYDLAKVRSKKQADKLGPNGVAQLYVNWINFCDHLLKSQPRGIGVPPMAHAQSARTSTTNSNPTNPPTRSIQMWGDIILNHPDLIPQLPPDATLLEWGYEHDHKFDEHCKTFADRLLQAAPPAKSKKDSLQHSAFSIQRSFYVSPGTSSWLTLSARTKNAFANIHNAATAGLRHHARGILTTDWGDHGHQQLLAVSLLPFAYGAAASWNLKATPNPMGKEIPRSEPSNLKSEISNSPTHSKIKNQKSKIPNDQLPITNYNLPHLLQSISLHLFEDPTAQFASLAYDLGLTYERLGWQRFNASLDHFLFREKWAFANYVNRAPAAALHETIRATQSLLEQFQSAISLHPDADLLRAEFTFTCHEILHTCRRTQLRKLWLAASPKSRNPEEPTLRDLPPQPLPKDFPAQMRQLRHQAQLLSQNLTLLWLTRNKPSRLADLTAEFTRLISEYQKFAK